MQKQIDEIMDWFNFGQVHKAMAALNWQWSDSEGVPMAGELREAARRLLTDAANDPQKYVHTGTGGFEVEKWGNNLTLRFVVSDWSAGTN
jgi:hypothetical protein